MGCCGLGTCTDPTCYLCTVLAPTIRAERSTMQEQVSERRVTNPTRNGVATKKGRDPVFTPRQRKALR